eukprot:762554-Hanusia_phi.AAC.1
MHQSQRKDFPVRTRRNSSPQPRNSRSHASVSCACTHVARASNSFTEQAIGLLGAGLPAKGFCKTIPFNLSPAFCVGNS